MTTPASSTALDPALEAVNGASPEEVDFNTMFDMDQFPAWLDHSRQPAQEHLSSHQREYSLIINTGLGVPAPNLMPPQISFNTQPRSYAQAMSTTNAVLPPSSSTVYHEPADLSPPNNMTLQPTRIEVQGYGKSTDDIALFDKEGSAINNFHTTWTGFNF